MPAEIFERVSNTSPDEDQSTNPLVLELDI